MERERGGMTSSKRPQVELNWGLCISYAEHLLTASWEIPIILLIVLLHGLVQVTLCFEKDINNIECLAWVIILIYSHNISIIFTWETHSTGVTRHYSPVFLLVLQ